MVQSYKQLKILTKGGRSCVCIRRNTINANFRHFRR